jgi:hypothetical protein
VRVRYRSGRSSRPAASPVIVIYEVATVNATSALVAVLPLVSSARTCVVYLVPNVTPMNPKLNVHDVLLLHTGAA